MNKKVLLIGLPNVGKSVIFNKLTGINTGVANYAGTTVEYTVGKMISNFGDITIIDVPGCYTLDVSNEAERVAVEMLNSKPDVVVCVLDANCLESSIYLMMQVLQKGLPVIGVLNRVDIVGYRRGKKRRRFKSGSISAKRSNNDSSRCYCVKKCNCCQGLDQDLTNKNFTLEKEYPIDIQVLGKELGTMIIPMVATKAKGIAELKAEISNIISSKPTNQKGQGFIHRDADWTQAERIVTKIYHQKEHDDNKIRKRLEQMIIKPYPGLIIAFFTLTVTFAIIIGLGMSIRRFLLLPFFSSFVFPAIISLVELLLSEGFFRNVLIGEYGFLIKGIEWPIALVLPYVVSFYFALSLLEDSGYLPRLGILLDGILNKIGLSGANIIPIILGYGCTIPAIASTRAMNTKKERLIVVTMVSLSVPCISQTGVFITLLAERSVIIVLALFVFSLLAAIGTGYVSNLILKGSRVPLTITEVPVLLAPDLSVLGKKVWVRLKSFLAGGAVIMFYAIFVTSVLYESGIFQVVGRVMAPIVENLLRLPQEASVPLVLGIIRRELVVLPLLEMELSSLQLLTGSVVGLFYVPCIAVVTMIAKEFGWKIAGSIFIVTILVSFSIGGLIAFIGNLIV